MSSNNRGQATRWPDKIVVGLTGNIATGKSSVLRMAAENGALTLDADKIVHEILEHDPSVQAAIAVAFGSQVRKSDGRIDRAALAAIVFSDAAALRDLEMMLHPAVRTEIIQRVNESRARVVFIEAIKLLEGPLVNDCNAVWVTACSPVRQLERLMICRGMDDQTAAMRVNAQPPAAEKVARANVVINTDADMADTRLQFETAWAQLLQQPAIAAPLPAQTKATPAPAATKKVMPEPAPVLEMDVSDVTVRRARPSDVPAVLLLIHKATEGQTKIKRADLLMSMAERSYLIGQEGAEITTVIGWAADSGVARIEQIYIHPLSAVKVSTPAVMAEIERTAQELICEAIMAFPPQDAPEAVRLLFAGIGYEPRQKAQLPRVWRSAADESQPENTQLLVKVLRNVRIA